MDVNLKSLSGGRRVGRNPAGQRVATPGLRQIPQGLHPSPYTLHTTPYTLIPNP